jgi:hypothetical protein
MPVSRTRKITINKRREKVADLYCQGRSQIEIAEIVGVKQPTISIDLKKIQAQWRESAVRDFDLEREIVIQKIDRVEREAWDAWERSQKPVQSVRTSDEPNNRRTHRTVRNRNGDPRYLEIVLRCIRDRREVLGLDAPKKMEIDAHVTSDAERSARILAIVAALGDRQGAGDAGAGLVLDQPRQLCADSEPGPVAPGPPPQLLGPGDC